MANINPNGDNVIDSDMPTPPVVDPPPVDTPPVPVLSPGIPADSSDYPLDRGSAAAVNQPKAATQAKPDGKPRRRGKSDGGQPRSRSRSEEAQVASPSRVRKADVSDHVQLLQVQIQAMGERLTKLEGAHQAGQDVIGSFADRLVEENAKLDARLVALKVDTEGHLTTVEETFRRCDKVLEELRTASQAAASAAAHALASSPGVSASTGTSQTAMEADLLLLRTQLDATSAIQLTFNDRTTSVEDRLVAHEMTIQSAVAEITTLALSATLVCVSSLPSTRP